MAIAIWTLAGLLAGWLATIGMGGSARGLLVDRAEGEA